MADEELDAGLVERLRDALPGTCRGKRCVLPLNNGVRCPCADPVLRVLDALPIPAAALNALARGEAVVVPKVQTREICNAKQEVHGFSPMSDEAWARVQFAGIDQELWSAMLAASPYAAPRAKET